MKNLLVDFGYYQHKAIFACRFNPRSPSTYTCFSMILSDLKKVGIKRNDLVIIACDRGRSWRKDIDSQYKCTRKGKRDSFTDINWDKEYKSFNQLLENIQQTTPFKVIGVWGTEADDVISYCVRKYSDTECIILSVDEDFEQLFCFNNVKIYSPHPKRKCFKIPPKNPYDILMKKVEKERSDDLINPVTNEKEFKDRFLIVNLLELPKEIEDKIERELENNNFEKDWDLFKFKFPSLIKRIKQLYNQDKVVKEKVYKQKKI